MKKLLVILVVIVIFIGTSVLWNQFTGPRAVTQSESQRAPKTGQTTQVPTTCSGSAIAELTEGPYYKANSPERQTIREADTPTILLTLEGYVFDTDCKPIANAWIDFWQADGEGNYDNSGYVLRGYQYTDANGKYKLITVVPGQYPSRTEHIHFKIKTTDTAREITSQLFIPEGTTNPWC